MKRMACVIPIQRRFEEWAASDVVQMHKCSTHMTMKMAPGRRGKSCHREKNKRAGNSGLNQEPAVGFNKKQRCKVTTQSDKHCSSDCTKPLLRDQSHRCGRKTQHLIKTTRHTQQRSRRGARKHKGVVLALTGQKLRRNALDFFC